MIKNILKKLYEKFILWGYVRYGLYYGDELSYSFMGDCVNSVERYYNFFHKRYCQLGYEPISLDDWIIAGGYSGIKHVQNKLLIKKL